MKKILGVLVLVLAISGIASGGQDFLKKIAVRTEWRYQWKGISSSDEDSTPIGNAGFKKEKRSRTRWHKTISGTVNLSEEWILTKYKIKVYFKYSLC